MNSNVTLLLTAEITTWNGGKSETHAIAVLGGTLYVTVALATRGAACAQTFVPTAPIMDNAAKGV